MTKKRGKKVENNFHSIFESENSLCQINLIVHKHNSEKYATEKLYDKKSTTVVHAATMCYDEYMN